MNLDKNDISINQQVGHTLKGELIYHIETKGGCSLICRKNPSGAMTVLARASHPAIARHMAQELDKSIQYDESLFKSQDGTNPDDRIPNVKFTPQLAFDLAKHHSGMAGKTPLDTPESKLKYLHHVDRAIKHYKASGLDHKDAEREHAKYQKMHHSVDPSNPPFIDEPKLEQAYTAKYGKPYPAGLEEIFNKESGNV